MYTCNHAAEDYHDACSDVMMVRSYVSIVCMHLTMRITRHYNTSKTWIVNRRPLLEFGCYLTLDSHIEQLSASRKLDAIQTIGRNR